MDLNEKFANFMRGISAAAELDARAAGMGCFVECVCLTASVIDGLLRMGLILQHQLDTGTSDLLEDLLHQADGDPVVSEREVYRRALAAGVIGQPIFDDLEAQYQDRNRVVHRYIISGITTADVLAIAMRQNDLKHRVADCVAEIEERQISLGVGMTVCGHMPVKQEVLDSATEKHGDDALAQALREGL